MAKISYAIDMNLQLSEQELIRIGKRKALEEIGIPPYPSCVVRVNAYTVDILANYNESCKDSYSDVVLAGRIMSRRIMGAASFLELQDAKGRIQLYVQRDTLACEDASVYYDVFFKKLLDIGDIVEVHGFVFTTKAGSIAVHVKQLKLLCKSLAPLPVIKKVADENGGIKVHDAFTDPEQRYRRRYVDLIVNPHVKEVFIKRARLIQVLREELDKQGLIEVDTPILQSLYGGAAARPFVTHHNALDMTLYLRIAKELYLKRLIVGGFDGVYELSKDFRNEGMSRFHNPEFTQVEFYVAYKDYIWMMDYVEHLIERVALALNNRTDIQAGDHIIDFKSPWKRVSMFEIIAEFTGYDISDMDEDQLRRVACELNVSLEGKVGKGNIIDAIFGEKCEPYIIQPTFITDYPIELSPLAKRRSDDASLTERFEVICNGKEICNGFSELNDPIDQQERFEEQSLLREGGDEEAMLVDYDFLRALRYGMPPTAGVGIGIDRLTMIMANVDSIQDVIFFPHMRLENM